MGVDPPGGIWAHICGSDLIRDADGTVYVLEDNLRVPSGVSYLLENRMVAKHVFPEMFRALQHRTGRPLHRAAGQPAGLGLPVDRRSDHRGAHPGHLQLGLLRARLPGPAARRRAGRRERPRRPGRRLRLRADHRGPPAGRRHLPPHRRPLPRSRGLPARLDAGSARADPGLAMRAGWPWSTLPGAGIADDKKVYSYVPDIIRFFLDEEPDPGHRAHAPVQRRRARATTCSATSSDWWSSRPTSPGGYGVLGGPAGHRPTSWPMWPSRSRTTRTDGWPSR